jgi:predicted Zn-dependent protease
MIRSTSLYTLILVLLLFSSGCAVNPATGKRQLSLVSISTEEEVNVGKKSFPLILQKMGGELPDKELQAYIQKVGERLAAASHRKDINYTFRVVNDSTPNAFALPGGYIAITRGLLVHLRSEDQLAAVLGHEIGHVDARHSVQGIQRSTLLNVGVAVLAGVTSGSEYGSLIRSSGEMAATLADRSYSRAQEEESDLLGIDYMVESNYDPQGAVELQRIFFQQIENGRNPQWLEGLFRTHPFSRKRMEQNREYIVTRYGAAGNTFSGSNNDFLQVTTGLRENRKAYELYDKARLAEKEGETGKAITLYLQAAEQGPEEALILTGLGMAYLRQEDMVTARQHLQRAVRLDGEYYFSRLGLAYIYLNQGNYDRTIKHAEKSSELLPTVEAAYLLGRGYDGSGNGKKALQYYRAVERADPKSKMGRHAAARIVMLEGGK